MLFCSFDQPVKESTKLDKRIEKTRTLTGTWRIAQIGLAATAIPTFFKPAKFLHSDGTEKRYIDASFEAIDPTIAILTLAVPDGEPPHGAVGTIVSMGVNYGVPHSGGFHSGGFHSGDFHSGDFHSGDFHSGGLLRWYRKYPEAWIRARDDHREHFIVAASLEHEYVRLEVLKIWHINVDTWKGKRGADTLNLIRKKTDEHLNSADVKAQIRATAKRLVDHRRSRAEADLDRWEVFCHGTEYACTMARCPVIDQTFKDRRGLRSHLEKVHRLDPGKVEPLLDKGKRFPLYEESG